MRLGLILLKRKSIRFGGVTLFLLVYCLSLFSVPAVNPAAAQSTDEIWSTPQNISRSGAASNPLAVKDSNGTVHIIWQDLVAGNTYAYGDGVQWSEPVPVDLPFDIYVPTLVPHPAGYIFAFWRDDENNLYTSHVEASFFANPNAWTTPLLLGSPVLNLHAVADADGQIHLGYVQSTAADGSPAGVYYRRMETDRRSWVAPVILYQSPYFRSLTPETANVRVAAGTFQEQKRIYVVWDNRPRERVYFSMSADNGANWEPPREVAAPAEGTLANGPSNIRVAVNGGEVLLLWQSDRSGANCVQYFEFSTDGGVTFSGRQPMLEGLPGCPQDTQFIQRDDGSILLFTAVFQQSYLLAWENDQWSNPQGQPELSGFIDEDTFRQVQFSCRQPIFMAPDRLLVIGCDQGGGNDIWSMDRQLTDTSAWFTDEPLWRSPITITKGVQRILSPALVADSQGILHAVWSQPDPNQSGTRGTAIYYARFEDGRWTPPEPVLSSSGDISEQPAAAIDASGNLLVVWSGGQSNEIFFSKASAARAGVASAWSQPLSLPVLKFAASSPDLVTDSQGRIFVVYVIPLNEERGVYLTRSDDLGESWTDPVRVFDAAAADWAMVDQPVLTVTQNGHLHLMWTRYSLPNGVGSMGLFYARSDNGGETWSQPETVADKPVLWSEITGYGEATVHRVWKELSGGRTTLWHEHSLDSGVTWERISPTTIFADTIGEPAIAVDPAGTLHLLQFGVLGPSNYNLQHWVWRDASWQSEQSLNLESIPLAELGDLVASVAPDGSLGVAFRGLSLTAPDGSQQDNLFFSVRQLELPDELPTPLPTLTPGPTAAPTSTPTPEATQVVLGAPTGLPGSGVVQPLPTERRDSGNVWMGAVIGLITAGALVGLVFYRSIARSKNGRW